ncbi:ATP-binding cassette domain-containing protein [Ectothiorhodospiraceae bacterium BW-2]|nr:ATP-binding cassette domain-containing protein [Ectothiorhodospiraceae bacterium BW-2]
MQRPLSPGAGSLWRALMSVQWWAGVGVSLWVAALLVLLPLAAGALMASIDTITPLQWFAVLFGLVMTTFWSAVAQRALFLRLAESLTEQLSTALFERLLRLEIGERLARIEAQLNSFNRDLPELQQWLGRVAPQLLLQLPLLLLTLALMLVISWESALTLALLLAALELLLPWLDTLAQRQQQQQQHYQQQLNDALLQPLRRQPLLRLYRLQGGARREFEQLLQQRGQSFRSVGSQLLQLQPLLLWLRSMLLLGVAIWVAHRYQSQQLSVAELTSLLLLMPLLSYSLSNLPQQWRRWRQVEALWRRMAPLWQLSLREEPEEGQRPVGALQQGIWLNEVTFRPAEGELSLLLELYIKRGEHLAIVGEQLSGKSYFMRLLAALERPSSGQIYFDETPYSHLAPGVLQQQMGCLFKEPLLLRDTIFNNIRAARADANESEVVRAAQEAECHELIQQLPQRYQTLCDEHSSPLDLELQQRIALARALLTRPQILLLDGSLSQFDPVAEHRFVDTLHRIMVGRTVVVASQRLSIIATMARIVVLHRGQIVEQGSHDLLLQRNGHYARIWLKQSLTQTNGRGEAEINMERLLALPPLAVLHLRQRLGLEGVERLRRSFITEHYPAGHLVFADGAAADRFRIIARGSVEVFKPAELDSPERHIAYLTEGDYFGEGALLLDRPRSASVRTVSATTCLSVGRQQFVALMEAQPELNEDLRSVFEARWAQLQ